MSFWTTSRGLWRRLLRTNEGAGLAKVSDLSSLWDLACLGSKPSVETVGYYLSSLRDLGERPL